VRLEMLYALREGERCVCRLQELSGLDMSTVSRHLSVLKNAGLVTARKDKNWIFYTLACPCALDFADCLEK
jgi:ArsR family transcriptional regulator